jgi:ferric-dicitrate binding protein FerR (iron transport regulator)
MSPHDSDRSLCDARVAATNWVIDLYTSHDPGSLLPQFLAWLKASPENRSEYFRMQEIWRLLTDLNDRAPLSAPSLHTPPASLPDPHTNASWQQSILHSRLPRRPGRWARLAFAARIVVLLSPAILFHRPNQQFANPPMACDTCKLAHGSFASEVGHASTLLNLIDGSTISLDANARVTLDLSSSHRLVWLDRGTALFHVSKNRGVAFDVQVGRITVSVVGTTFSVENKGRDAVKTVVLEGAVAVRTRNDTSDLVVRAGDIAEVDAEGIHLVHESASGLEERLASAPGHLHFERETLAEAAAAFNRYNRRQISVDAEVARVTISGEYPSNDPEGFATALREMGIEYSLSRNPNTAVETIHLRAEAPRGNSHSTPDNRNGRPGRT